MIQMIFNQLHKGTRKNGSRKSDRTDEMHRDIVSDITEQIPDFDEKYIIEYESKISCAYGNKFTIDILVRERNTFPQKIHTVILAKAFISSVQKNRANNANTSIGEVIRVLGNNPDVNIFFVTIIPNKIPNYIDGFLKGLHDKDVSYVDLKKVMNDHPVFKPFKNQIYHGTITYDVKGVDYNTKETLHNTLKKENIVNIDRNSFDKSVENIFG